MLGSYAVGLLAVIESSDRGEDSTDVAAEVH